MGTKVEWLYYILQAFNAGDLVRYQELCQVHNAALRAQPALVENEKKLLEKINILCLMEIIFRHAGLAPFSAWYLPNNLIFCIIFVLIWFYCSRPSEDRTIPLKVIAERTKLSIEDVEHLLMKSLSVSFTYSSFSQECLFQICPWLWSLQIKIGSRNYDAGRTRFLPREKAMVILFWKAHKFLLGWMCKNIDQHGCWLIPLITCFILTCSDETLVLQFFFSFTSFLFI